MLKSNIYIIFQIAGVVLLGMLISCDNTTEVLSSMDEAYFPQNIGKYKIYKVDTTRYEFKEDGLEVLNTSSYSREEAVDTIRRGQEVWTKWAVSYKKEFLDPWILTHFVLEKQDEKGAQRIEYDVRQILLTYPLNGMNEWEVNAFVNTSLQLNFGTHVFRPLNGWSLASISMLTAEWSNDNEIFGDVVVVDESISEAANALRESISHYAPNIGLVARYQRLYDIDCNGTPSSPCHDFNVAWEDDLEYGYALTKEIIDYN